MVADRCNECIPVGAKSPGIIHRFQRNLHADLRREHVDLRAVHMPDDLIPFAPAAPRTLPKLGRDPCGHLAEGAPGSLQQRDLPLTLSVGHRRVLRPGRSAGDAAKVGHPYPVDPLDHLEPARRAELGAEAGQLRDRRVAASIGGQDRKHILTDPGAAVPSRPVESAGHHPLLPTLLKHHPNRNDHAVTVRCSSADHQLRQSEASFPYPSRPARFDAQVDVASFRECRLGWTGSPCRCLRGAQAKAPPARSAVLGRSTMHRRTTGKDRRFSDLSGR